jgi:hypothetical protein
VSDLAPFKRLTKLKRLITPTEQVSDDRIEALKERLPDMTSIDAQNISFHVRGFQPSNTYNKGKMPGFSKLQAFTACNECIENFNYST